jgi:hypothetical protein
MLEIGRMNQLRILREVDFGLYLDDGEDGEILLPVRYMPEHFDIGDYLDVFISYDSEDRLVATTDQPYAMVGEFALLKVVALSPVGAFLDWGLPKDLFLPFAEQSRPLKVGQDVIVYIYIDNSERIAASMRLERNLSKKPHEYELGQQVDLMIIGKTDLGFKAIIEGQHLGLLFENEVFQPLEYGQAVTGFIKNIRPDGKIDLSLKIMRTGHTAAEDIAPQILAELEKKGGFLPIDDKTPAETIYKLFGVSKKKYKMALGGLYKKRLITISDDGIRLNANEPIPKPQRPRKG